jgi:hypothetical protein
MGARGERSPDLNRYAKGARFEHKVMDHLVDLGYSCIRAAGSKGDTKIDIVAFKEGFPIMLIQAKTDGKISKAEWDRVLQVSQWYGHGLCVAVLAANGPKGVGVTYTRILGQRVLYARSQPCEPYLPGIVKRPTGRVYWVDSIDSPNSRTRIYDLGEAISSIDLPEVEP